MPLCGPKLSLCCSIISMWAVVQLILMGAFYWTHSVALIEDLPEIHLGNISAPSGTEEWHNKFYEHLKEKYEMNARNCWIVSGFYVLTLLFSVSQLYLHKRANPS